MLTQLAPRVRGQDLVDRALQRRQQLALLRLRVRLQLSTGEDAPALGLERNLAPLPGAPAQLHRRLEQRKLVDPGREAAGAAEVVEAREHAHERVVRGLERDLVELVAAQVRQRLPTARDLVPGGAQQERVQASNRLRAHG